MLLRTSLQQNDLVRAPYRRTLSSLPPKKLRVADGTSFALAASGTFGLEEVQRIRPATSPERRTRSRRHMSNTDGNLSLAATAEGTVTGNGTGTMASTRCTTAGRRRP